MQATLKSQDAAFAATVAGPAEIMAGWLLETINSLERTISPSEDMKYLGYSQAATDAEQELSALVKRWDNAMIQQEPIPE